MDSVASYLEVGASGLQETQQHVPSSVGVVRRIDFEGVSEDETIRVFLRVKPISLDTINDTINTKHFKTDGHSITAITTSGKAELHNEYFFNAVLSPTATQTEVFDLIVRSRLEEVLQGADTLLFSYGTTSSGKSYTIQGKGSEPGIIPRVLYVIFASIENNEDKSCTLSPLKSHDVMVLTKKEVQLLKKEKELLLQYADDILLGLQSNVANDSIRATSSNEMAKTLENVAPIDIDKMDCLYSIWISFIEVYNENIFDLLVYPDETKVPLKIAFDSEKRAYVKGVKYMCISTWEEAYKLYLFGKHNLHVSSTSQNKNSSRSHCVLNIKIIKRPLINDDLYYSVSCFTICDLAGAERQKITRNVGTRLKESQSINTSLLVLNRCFNIIRTNQIKKNQEQLIVPYRESKLTLLFQHSLSGKTSITMITNISQSDELFSETNQVLKATAIANKIKAKPFTVKRYHARRSIFSNYCSTRIEVIPPITLSDTDEGVGSSFSCRTCLEYKKEIDQLQETIDQQEVKLCEEKEKCDKRVQDVTNDLVEKFAKMLEDSDKKFKERVETLKTYHRKDLERTKKFYKECYEKKLNEMTTYEEDCESSFVQMKKELHDQPSQSTKEKLLKLCELFDIACPSGNVDDISIEPVLDKIIEISSLQSQEKAEPKQDPKEDNLTIKNAELEANINHLQTKNNELEEEINSLKTTHMGEVHRIQGELLQLKRKIEDTGDIFEIHDICEGDETIRCINILDKVNKAFRKFKFKLKNQEKMLTAAVNDFTQLENVVKTLERDKFNLEEELAIKDNKISELLNDVKNLNEILAAKSSEQQLDMEPLTVKLGHLMLDDGSEKALEPTSESDTTRKITRGRRKKTYLSESENDDPTFFLPVQSASTRKKKKKTSKKTNKIDVLATPFSKDKSVDEGLSNSTVRSRRKLFRKESLNLGDDDVVLQIEDPEMSQQSPHTCLKTLRPRKH